MMEFGAHVFFSSSHPTAAVYHFPRDIRLKVREIAHDLRVPEVRRINNSMK